MVKPSNDYEDRFSRLSARIEKFLARLIFGLLFLLVVGQCVVQLPPLRVSLVETTRWEGSAHILQK